ncbi:MAG: hypothetical protein ACU0DK_05670 [Pseudooceanicola sp.]
MPIPKRTISTTARSIWLRRIDPSVTPPAAGLWRNIDLPALGHAAARETFMTATPHMASIWTDLFQSILAPGLQLCWREDGPGIGRDAKSAYSSLLGRYMARAYLTAFEGVRVLVPLDIAKRWFEGTSFEIRKDPSGNGLEADWIGLDGNGLVIVEAKGSHNNALAAWANPTGSPTVLESAIGQVERTAVFRRTPNRKLPSKRWAIASRWGTEQNGRDPTVIAWDPDEGELEGDDYKELERILLQADLQAVATGMRYTYEVGAFSGFLTVTDGPGDRLRVGNRLMGPGLFAAVGPFGIFPIRTQTDLPRVGQARDLVPNMALAALSAQYIRSVREGFRPGGDGLLVKDHSASQGGLTIIWPEEDEEIDLEQ